jgi:hypothetical protein
MTALSSLIPGNIQEHADSIIHHPFVRSKVQAPICVYITRSGGSFSHAAQHQGSASQKNLKKVEKNTFQHEKRCLMDL